MLEDTDYELAVLAEEDLKGIARYRKDTWGLQQAKSYETLLIKSISTDCTRPRSAKILSRPQTRPAVYPL